MNRINPDAAAQLWVANTDSLQASPTDRLWCALSDTLDGAERARVQALTFERDRKAFVLAHGLCRAILGRALGHSTPYSGPYRRGEWGKPRVVGGVPGFALSQHNQWVAVLLARDSRCGVSIVSRRPGQPQAAPWSAAAGCTAQAPSASFNKVLCAHEHGLVTAAPEPHQALLKVQALKQAYVEAVGVVLMRPLSAFTVLDTQGRISPGDRHLRQMKPFYRQSEKYHLAAWVQSEEPLSLLERSLSLQDVFKLLKPSANSAHPAPRFLLSKAA